VSKPSIENLWNKLDPKAQEWLRANPGSVILPRSVTEALLRASGEYDGVEGIDGNGQLPLSPEDQAFLKTVAHSEPVGHPVPPATPSL
jgi:hypothetical protein